MKTDRELLERALGVLEATKSEQKSPVESLEKQNHDYRKRLKQIEDAMVDDISLYRHPAPARKPLSDEEIREIMLENGFSIKEGCQDLKAYVYAAVRAIEKAHGIGEEE